MGTHKEVTLLCPGSWALAVSVGVLVVALAGCGGSRVAEPAPAEVTRTVTASPPGSSAQASEPADTAPSSSEVTETSSPRAGWEQIVEQVRSGVVRLEVATCDSRRGWGTGFVVGENEIMTAAHVALEAAAVSVQGDGYVTTAELVALDRSADVALLHTAEPVGPPLTLSTQTPTLGSPLALLGFPEAVTDLRVSVGIVSGLEGVATYPDIGIELQDLIVTDAAVNAGNSGGPVLNRAGEVVGLVTGMGAWFLEGEAVPKPGSGLVVPSAQLQPAHGGWGGEAPQVPACEGAVAPGPATPELAVEVVPNDQVAHEIARSLTMHGQGINTGQYGIAWQLFTPQLQQRLGSIEEWTSELETSFWTELRLLGIERHGPLTQAQVDLTTVQAPQFGHEGQTCSRWSMTYSMTRSGGGWLIDRAEAPPPRPC